MSQKTKIAINGFGRIGRAAFRIALANKDLEIAAINDLTDNKTLAHLLKYDSVYGKYEKEVSFTDDGLMVEGKKYPVFSEKEPEKLPWKKLGIDVVLECTGRFTLKEEVEKHLKAGAKKVIISAPSKSADIPTYVLGVNEKKYNNQEKIISCASCTTNCLAPIVKVLHQNFTIKQGLMTTVHSYTNDQSILDFPHKDLRRARAAALSIIPTTTGAAKTVEKVIPELKGKLDGISLRVPTPTVSIVDFQAVVSKSTTVEEVNKCFINASQKELKGILGVSNEPLVSMDYKGDRRSSIIDLELTMVKDNLIKVVSWYDNEWAYACRLVELAEYIS